MKNENKTKQSSTPGPWTHDETWGLIVASNGTEIAACHSGIKANARLIAAAPTCLWALRSAETALASLCRLQDKMTENEARDFAATLSLVRDAIARAEGRDV